MAPPLYVARLSERWLLVKKITSFIYIIVSEMEGSDMRATLTLSDSSAPDLKNYLLDFLFLGPIFGRRVLVCCSPQFEAHISLPGTCLFRLSSQALLFPWQHLVTQGFPPLELR